MIVDELKERIESYARDVELSHPLMLRARAGTLTPHEIAAYVSNMRYSMRCIYRHLVAARDRAEQLGLEVVAEYFSRKFDEEYGHDAWAEEDLARLSADYRTGEFSPTPTMVEFMDYLTETVQNDPRYYLAYTLFLEYLTVLAGPQFLAAIEEHCGIPKSHMSVVSKHVELDKHHVDEALEEMTVLTRGVDRAGMAETLARSMDFFSRSCTEVMKVAA